jgi:putative transcriptional regulator
MENRYTAERVRHLRERAGMLQAEFADYLGINQSTVSRLEAGNWPPRGPVIKLLDNLRASIRGRRAKRKR